MLHERFAFWASKFLREFHREKWITQMAGFSEWSAGKKGCVVVPEKYYKSKSTTREYYKSMQIGLSRRDFCGLKRRELRELLLG